MATLTDAELLAELINRADALKARAQNNVPVDGNEVCTIKPARRMPIVKRILARAAPTCTLYSEQFNTDVYFFRPWPKWYFTGQDVVEAS